MGGIAPGELAAIRGRLEAFADDIFESLPRKDQRARGACYLRGLMLEGRRKSVEPMAQRLGGCPLPGVAPFRGGLAVGLAAGPPPAGRAAGQRAGADGLGGGRHRLPQRR